MEKTACTDKESSLFFITKAGSAMAAIAASARTGFRVTVYALVFRFGMIAAFPKERRICTVIQIFPHTAKKNRLKNKRFTNAYYDVVVIPLKKPALLFWEPA
jgi:hypothetical protein